MTKKTFFAVLFVSFSFALISFSKPSSKPTLIASAIDTIGNIETEITTASPAESMYEGLKLEKYGLSISAFEHALKGYEKLVNEGSVHNTKYLTIIDMSQSSRRKRFYLIDVQNKKIVHTTFVSHGKNTGLDMAQKFSNEMNSEKSSLGFFVTSETYTGKHGLSLRLSGLEAGFNDNAEARGVVVHGAGYVNANRVNSAYMGRSQGCPALPEAEYNKVINLIKGGSVMFIYHPTQQYIQQSKLLKG